MMKSAICLGAFLAAVAVVMGAVGAHLAPDDVAKQTLQAAALYQLVHGLALIVSAHIFGRFHVSSLFFAVGIFLFSGSIYVSNLTNVSAKFLAPYGGSCLILGWLIFCGAAAKLKPRSR